MESQCTAIDDATRIRALKAYERHNQRNAIDFIGYVIKKFPSRIQTIRTDNGHEFQAKFHWHVEDQQFSGLLTEIRRDLANTYIRNSQLSLNEIAYLLGFTEPASFTRAFRRWNGTSPSDFRRKIKTTA